MLFSQVAFGIVLAFGAGIFFASFFPFAHFFILFFLVIGIMLLSVFWKRWNAAVHIGVLIVVAAFGMAHYTHASQLPEPILLPQEVSFEGRIITTPQKDEQGPAAWDPLERGYYNSLLYFAQFTHHFFIKNTKNSQLTPKKCWV